MKMFLIVALAVIFNISSSFSQNHQGPYIEFDPELYDLGEISTDDIPEGKINFKIYNLGNQPLVMSSVRACCGTRVNDYTREPIAENDSGFVEVQFRIIPRPHRIRRTVTIQSNAENRKTAVLRIQGEVVEPKGDLEIE